MTTTQPIAGNQSFTNVVNLAGQVPNLDVADLERVSGSLIVGGEIVCDELDVQGLTLLQGDVQMNNNAVVQGVLTAGEVAVNNNAVVQGVLTAGEVVVNGPVAVTGTSVLLGAVEMNSTVDVAGLTTFAQGVAVTGDLGVGDSLKVSGSLITFTGLPNAAPQGAPGQLWNNAGVINIT